MCPELKQLCWRVVFKSALLSPFLLLLIICGAGCSSFNRDWKAASRAAGPASNIQGRWEGRWLSHTNGHHGRLRCLVNKSSEGQYLARFHANYKKILSFGYTVPLLVREALGVYHFSGDADLGRLAGGSYHYEGQATATNFFSTYQAKADGGVFEMKRPH